jgi:hypothetical protein
VVMQANRRCRGGTIGIGGAVLLGETEFNSTRIADGKLEEGSSKISIQYVQQFSPITSPRGAAAEALSGCVYSRLAVCDSHQVMFCQCDSVGRVMQTAAPCQLAIESLQFT